MRTRFTTLLTVLGTVTLLLLVGNGVALATTGHGFVLGQANKAKAQTTLSRTTPGAVLGLHSKSTSNPPLSVNGKGKVTNLNADAVDGFDASALRNRTYVFTKSVTTATGDVVLDAAVPAGTYLVTYAAYVDTPSPSDSLDEVACTVAAGDSVSGFGSAANTAVTTTSFFTALSGAGVVTKPATATAALRLECTANDPTASQAVPFVTPGNTPIQLTLTRLDTVTSSP